MLHRTKCTAALFVVTGICRFKVPRSPQEEKEHFARMEEEAKARGFGRRGSGDDKIFMDKTFHTPEKVDGIAVANLPAKVKEETEFDKYERSSTEFTSIVSPHGKEVSPLGAGFGVKPDKRLGFLRPKQTLQPFSGGATSITPKFDENGMPVDDTLSRDQLMKKRMDYLKSIEGTTMSRNEHFLLADLDFEKDAVLFGNTREEFEKNVIKLKNVIIAYNKWERTDNFYYYTTIILKILVVWVLLECVQQYYDLCLFENNYDMFAEVMEKEIADLTSKRENDFALARTQLQQASPDFSPIVQAIREERDRVVEEKRQAAIARDMQAKQARSSGADGASGLMEIATAALNGQETTTPSPGSSTKDATSATATSVSAASLSPLQTPERHPMDTMGDAEYAQKELKDEERREMRRLYESSVAPGHFSIWGSLWNKIRGNNSSGSISQPLQQEDFALFSYAASPTSIDALRSVRRILLPRSEDYTQVVREEMLAYKRQKEERALYMPGDTDATSSV